MQILVVDDDLFPFIDDGDSFCVVSCLGYLFFIAKIVAISVVYFNNVLTPILCFAVSIVADAFHNWSNLCCY